MKENKTGKRREDTLEAGADGIIEGRNAVIEALRSGTAIDKIYVARGETDAALGHIASTARGRGVRPPEAGQYEPDPRPPGSDRAGGRAGVRQCGGHSERGPGEGGATSDRGVRRTLRPP